MKKNIFFVGAGGIGMAALERYFLSKGYNVGGYDLTPSQLTQKLMEEGVVINFVGDEDSIPENFRNPDDTTVVYTPAVPDDLGCMRWFRQKGFEIKKRAQILGEITRNSKSICFAGTHGKTTSSSIAAHILNITKGTGCNAFLGGILRNYGSNLILSVTSPYTVVEADEYDRSFHHLSPYIAVITSTDPDHLDIYHTEKEYLESFSYFTSLIEKNGYLLLNTGLKMIPRVKPSVKTYKYSTSGEEADFMAFNIERKDNHLFFDLKFPDKTVAKSLELGLPVRINIDNSVAAIGAVWLTGHFDENAVREALLSFKGAERRFELRWEEKNGRKRIIIDDYAHHPREITASINSIKEMYPGRKITIVFQPHLYSRTKDHFEEFAKALSLSDKVIITPIYPARERPIAGVDSNLILDKIELTDKALVSKEDFPEYIKNSNFDVLLTLGAGDLPNYIPALINILEN